MRLLSGALALAFGAVGCAARPAEIGPILGGDPLSVRAPEVSAETAAAAPVADAGADAAAPIEAPIEAPMPRSAALPNGLRNPMPGGTLAGYAADTGLDIAGSPRPVFAIAAGTLDYAEAGHTLWTGKHDTPFTIRFELDQPIRFGDRAVTHVYYGHLSKLAHVQHEGDRERRRVEAGEYLGMSGVARGSPHLHVGLLLDGDVSQAWGTFLSADEVRKVLGGMPNKTRLPNDPAAAVISERLR
jgi:murein DD-endopeptidase MepM/ murein hydrolase activator NlpD